MTQDFDEHDEEALGKHFLGLANNDRLHEPTQCDTEKAVHSAIQEANVQTGVRDLTTLLTTSIFSILLIFFAPMASLIARKKAEKNITK